MMRVAIVATDNIIVIDGEVASTDCAMLREDGISAVQWNEDGGHIEYDRHAKPNEIIDDFTPYQRYIDEAVWPEKPEPTPQPAEPKQQEPIMVAMPRPAPLEQMLFDYGNRLLALEGKPTIALEEFLAAWDEANTAYSAACQDVIRTAVQQ
jgi:hypothetical protein